MKDVNKRLCELLGDEQIKASREKYWSECSTEEKLERTRKAVKRLQRETCLLNKFMRYLQTHKHLSDGEVVIPISIKDEPEGFSQTGDDVYF